MDMTRLGKFGARSPPSLAAVPPDSDSRARPVLRMQHGSAAGCGPCARPSWPCKPLCPPCHPTPSSPSWTCWCWPPATLHTSLALWATSCPAPPGHPSCVGSATCTHSRSGPCDLVSMPEAWDALALTPQQPSPLAEEQRKQRWGPKSLERQMFSSPCPSRLLLLTNDGHTHPIPLHFNSRLGTWSWYQPLPVFPLTLGQWI